MKFKNIIYASLVSLAVLLCLVGCEDEQNTEKSKDKTLITATKNVDNIEWNGAGNERVMLEDDIQLILTTAEIWKQRESCSGFSRGTIRDITKSDVVEYTYYNEDSDLSSRKIVAVTARFFRYECLNPTRTDQWIHDEDRDGYTDNIDLFPTDPTRH